MSEVSAAAASPRARFTFHGNARTSRHGWLRLTPAYSVHFVRELLEEHDGHEPVLDPFCGTGTTLLACAERGIPGATVDLNPFLVWLARAKTAAYSEAILDESRALVRRMKARAAARTGATVVPGIHKIERWWDADALGALGRAAHTLRESAVGAGARDLAAIAFCRALIETANVSFGHQSMSFRKRTDAGAPAARRTVGDSLAEAFENIEEGARDPLARRELRVFQGDSRAVDGVVGGARFGAVVTSPPYSNRMSYIRELRPYMYWLGHLVDRRDAGELDWRAIGGTWGSATSRLATWKPDAARKIPYPGFLRIVSSISETEPLLGSYVHRYFEDMGKHVASVSRVLVPGAKLRYVVGNSKFYDVLLPAEEIFQALFEAEGLEACAIRKVRKRTSKRELYEYLVEGRVPLEPRPARKRRRGGPAAN
ncbi:MAG TPA: hypothetical protein VHE30_16470 [Polyangiaceae bacterium]|nr:hypothetical protein [Polyangiaceae bacterium]